MAVASAQIRSSARCEQQRDSTPLGGAVRPIRAMPASADPPADLTLPSLDLRALVRRAAAPAALAAAAALAVVVAGGPLHAFADAIRRALDADPRWVVAGAVFELLSFGGYVALLWLVGSRSSERPDLGASAQGTLGGAAAARLPPTGGAPPRRGSCRPAASAARRSRSGRSAAPASAPAARPARCSRSSSRCTRSSSSPSRSPAARSRSASSTPTARSR